jgi:RNA polymerase sigma-70 factor (sigma-E family)
MVQDAFVARPGAGVRVDHDAMTAGGAGASTPATFAASYAELQPEMVRLAAALTGDPEVAQDLVQDAFVRLHRAWNRVRDPRAYLRRAVVNACHSHHRHRQVERRHSARQLPAPDATLAANELVDALDALTHRQRAAVVLRFYADLSDADIAAALRCRPGTVPSLIHRGLEQLRRVIER